MEKKIIVVGVALLLSCVALALDWQNLTPDCRLGGRMVSEGYLRGKVVLLDLRDYGKKENADDVKGLQQIWTSYKSKPFVLVGGHSGTASREKVSKMIEGLGVTYPVYQEACPTNIAGTVDAVLVYDVTGRCLYKGQDVHKASGVAGSAIFGARRPSGPRAWKIYLDYEIANLPGHAYLRLRDLQGKPDEVAQLRKKFPADAKRYEERYAKYKDDEVVRKLAKLVELSRLVRDRDKDAKASQRLTRAVLEKEIAKYESLKESEDPNVVQEAKNAIADIKFAAAGLKK